MKIISINAGSSSLKFSLFNMDDEAVIASGLFERIGIEGSNYTIKFNGEKITQEAADLLSWYRDHGFSVEGLKKNDCIEVWTDG